MKLKLKTEIMHMESVSTGLTLERLQEVLRYNPKTGKLYWLVNSGNGTKAENEAGCLSRFGYIQIKIDGKIYKAHRLAFALFYKKWPKCHIDHRDCNRSNNIITNLRESDSTGNNYNRSISPSNTSGVKGVGWHKRMQKWRAQIRINGKKTDLGYFDNIIDAEICVRKARELHHGEFANHG